MAQLNGCRSNPPGTAMHQQGLTGLARLIKEQIAPHGEIRLAKPGCIAQRHTLWNWQTMRSLYCYKFGVATAIGQTAQLIAEPPSADISADGCNCARHLKPQKIRCTLWRWVMPTSLHQVGAIYACARHLDQNLRGANRWQRALCHNQHLGRARTIHFYNLHGAGQHIDLQSELQFRFMSETRINDTPHPVGWQTKSLNFLPKGLGVGPKNGPPKAGHL